MKIQASDRLESLPGYAFAEVNKKVVALKEAYAKGEAVAPIDFGVGDPSSPTPDFVVARMTELAEKHAGTGYPFYVGAAEYRQACSDYMRRRFGVELDAETEMCSNIGSKEAIFNFPEGFVNPGDIAICPSPGYPPMKTGTIFAEGEPYFVPLLEENDWLVDFESIPEDVCKRAKIIWINYPNSPTGAVAGREYYESLVAWARKHEIIIAADEGCYIDIYFEEKPMSILEVCENCDGQGVMRKFEGVVAFYSMSKRNNMTGYRAGFVCGDSEILNVYKRLKTNIDSGTPNIMQEAAMIALEDDEHVEEMRELYREKGEILMAALRDTGIEVENPKATFYLWVKVGDDVEFAKKLLDPKIGIVVTPGSLISDDCRGVNPGEGYVRFALMPTMEEMKEAARRIRESL